MFFGYPIEATAENWLHECLWSILHTIHKNLDDGTEIPAWPDILPEECREKLRNRNGLKQRLEKYQSVISSYKKQAIRQRVIKCLEEQNNIELLVSSAGECELIRDLPNRVQKPIKELFDFSFELLGKLGIRDGQYERIYMEIKDHVCPFCRCEYFDDPKGPREDFDHYLPRTLYPFAAANLQNLVPMGMKCNQRYKMAKDILRDDTGNRRKSFFPYQAHDIRVSLKGSIPFAGEDGIMPKWNIEFEPDLPECVTWNEVFHIRTRLERDVLKQSFIKWLRQFAAWFVKENGIDDLSDEKIIKETKRYAEIMEIYGMEAKMFLCAPVFHMMYTQCIKGNSRLFDFMRDLVGTAVLEAPVH